MTATKGGLVPVLSPLGHLTLVVTAFRARLLWLAAATHDIGIVLDRRDKTFTHRIDGRIDDERDKLMADFEFTGRVQATGLLERPTVPRLSQNGTGDSVETDGRLGVLVLEDTPPTGDRRPDR